MHNMHPLKLLQIYDAIKQCDFNLDEVRVFNHCIGIRWCPYPYCKFRYEDCEKLSILLIIKILRPQRLDTYQFIACILELESFNDEQLEQVELMSEALSTEITNSLKKGE